MDEQPCRGRGGFRRFFAPLERFLRSRLGRPWSEVREDLADRDEAEVLAAERAGSAEERRAGSPA
jgi:hypothetical protein